MTKAPSTIDQLRSLMSDHTATVAAASPAASALALPTQRSAATAALPRLSTPSLKPPRAATPVVPVQAQGAERCTVRLTASEIAQVNAIMLKTHQRTGKPITASDVLRIGLRRVGEQAPVTADEIAVLRATDGRRTRQVSPRL
jgi:hypothetical protein